MTQWWREKNGRLSRALFLIFAHLSQKTRIEHFFFFFSLNIYEKNYIETYFFTISNQSKNLLLNCFSLFEAVREIIIRNNEI